jgi:hypothetical protein
MGKLFMFSKRLPTKLTVDTDCDLLYEASSTALELYVESRDTTNKPMFQRGLAEKGSKRTAKANPKHLRMRRKQLSVPRHHLRHQIHFWKEENEEESRYGCDGRCVTYSDEDSDFVYRFVDDEYTSLYDNSNSNKDKKNKIRFIPVPAQDQNTSANLLYSSRFTHGFKAKNNGLSSSSLFPARTFTTNGGNQNDGNNDDDDFAVFRGQSSSFWTTATTTIANTFTADNTIISPKPRTSLYWVHLTPTYLSGIMATSIEQSTQTASATITTFGADISAQQPAVVAYVRLWEALATENLAENSPTLYSIPLPTINYFDEDREKLTTTNVTAAPPVTKELYAIWAKPQIAFSFAIQLPDLIEDSVVDSDAVSPVFVKLEVGVVVDGEERPLGLLVLDAMPIVDGRRSHTVQVAKCLQVPDCPVFRKRMLSFQNNKQIQEQNNCTQRVQSSQQKEPTWLFELGNDSTLTMQLVAQPCLPKCMSNQQSNCKWNTKSVTEKSLERLWKSKSFNSKYSVVLSPAEQYSTVGSSWCGCSVAPQQKARFVELDLAEHDRQAIINENESIDNNTFSSFYSIMSKCSNVTIPSSESSIRDIRQSTHDASTDETLWQDKQISELSIEVLYKESLP